MKVEVLGIKIDDINLSQAVSTVDQWLSAGNSKRRYIVTPNPEFLVAAQTDLRFKKILNDADLSIPDGVGLRLSGRVKNTVAGVDLMEELVKLSAEKGFTIGLLGGRNGVARKTSECLKSKFPGVKILWAEEGGEVDRNGYLLGVLPTQYPVVHPRSTSLAAATRRDPSSSSPLASRPIDLLFVAFGHIKQEKWIASNLSSLPVKVVMGVGGAFDYVSGRVPRAPRLVRLARLEWLFRLALQPWRVGRQLALIKYLWLLAFDKRQSLS